jgi:hypothetical protein
MDSKEAMRSNNFHDVPAICMISVAVARTGISTPSPRCSIRDRAKKAQTAAARYVPTEALQLTVAFISELRKLPWLENELELHFTKHLH